MKKAGSPAFFLFISRTKNICSPILGIWVFVQMKFLIFLVVFSVELCRKTSIFRDFYSFSYYSIDYFILFVIIDIYLPKKMSAADEPKGKVAR